MKKLLVLFLFVSFSAFGQEAPVDSTLKKDNKSKKELKVKAKEKNKEKEKEKEKAEEKPKKEWDTLKTKVYRITYPITWETGNSDGSDGKEFFIASPLDTVDDKFNETINLTVVDLKGKDQDLDKFANESETFMSKAAYRMNTDVNETLTDSNGVYIKRVYDIFRHLYHFRSEVHYRVHENKGYILAFIGEDEKYEKYKEKREKMLTSFRFLPKKEEEQKEEGYSHCNLYKQKSRW